MDFKAFDDLVPPHNLEAEEFILGGILLDPEAMARVADNLIPDAFYSQTHREIYQGALALHRKGQPTDLITVTNWLNDHGVLEKVGGIEKLAQLLEKTVSAVNIDRYASLTIDKFMRRQLISIGYDIIDLGHQTELELENIFDQAEQKVFSVTQERPQEGLIPISESLIGAFNTLEELQEKGSLPGLTCGFYDLDALTSGFQRSDLIVVAGRPSMGKTSFALGVAANVAKEHQLPIVIFSLEMSNEQLAQRLLASEAKIESNRLRAGHISQTEMEAVTLSIANLAELPIFIDDSVTLSVLQMRSQVRRLQAEQGGKIGLVLLDYLQLMEGGGDNRVQELAKITRSLKSLAREINAPVIALSQLSRSVETRTNKRPMLSDLRESGCLSGDTLITLAETGKQVPIRNLVGESNFKVLALNPETLKIEVAEVSCAFSTGVKPIFTLETRLGRKVSATANHKFFTLSGWKRLDELKKGDRIGIPRILPSSLEVPSKELYLLGNSDLYWDEIAIIEEGEKVDVYDLTVSQLHNFIANNIIVHNSIEQDADLVLMLYRDAYYNPDSPDRNIAEIIIAKHRNGPTGTIKLLFQSELTKFENLATN